MYSTGTGDDDDCPDAKQPAGFICNKEAVKPCITGGKCDGKADTCPAVKDVAIGTPCSTAGLFAEALDDKGHVAYTGSYPHDKAVSKGWSSCQRCYEGECQTFTYEM